MGELLNIVNPLHKRTRRDYVARMVDEKVYCMGIAKQYEKDYWDGDRRFGYGGYSYDGRWSAVAELLIERYSLKDGCRILDFGCGKGFLLYEFKKLLPGAEIAGFDISKHAIENAKPEIKDCIFTADGREKLDFEDKSFDLVVSLGVLHNFKNFELAAALAEIERVGKNKYMMAESFRSDLELFNLQCWALTCAAFMMPDEWEWFFQQSGYTGDYEFIYFE